MARAVFRDAVAPAICATGSPCSYPRAGCGDGESDEAPRVASEYGELLEGAAGDFLLISRSALDAVRRPFILHCPSLFFICVFVAEFFSFPI